MSDLLAYEPGCIHGIAFSRACVACGRSDECQDIKAALDAALARERRLREALTESLAWIDIRGQYPDDYSDATLRAAEKRWRKARAALAETSEP